MRAALAGFGHSLRVFSTVFASPELRRVALAFAGFSIAEWGTWVAMLVFAYGQGGVAAAGLVGVVQLVPAAIVVPFASLFGDRYPRERVLVVGYVAQGLAMAATAAALLGGLPVPVVYALAAVAATAVTLTRPVQAALLPALSGTPDELTAANVATSSIESLGLLAGPAIAAVLLDVASPGAVYAAMSAVVLGSAVLASGVAPRPGARVAAAPSDHVTDLIGGFRALGSDRRPRVVVGLMGAQSTVVGALDVLLVVLAFRLLDTGGAGVGFLNAAAGIGALLGSAATTALVGRRRLASALLGGALAGGLALVATGLVPGRAAAPVLIAASGAGQPLSDVAGQTLLQRVVPDPVLTRVFGLLEGFRMAGLAVGMGSAPTLVALLGDRAAFVAVGAFLPVLTLLAWPRLRALDDAAAVPEVQLAVLRAIPFLAPLPAPVLGRLAGRLVRVEVPAGTTVVREGDHGDRFYAIAAGGVTVTRGGQEIDAHGPGGFVGEIALLRDIPRTATVTARTDTVLWALERGDFLAAVTGHPESTAAADIVATTRLGRLSR